MSSQETTEAPEYTRADAGAAFNYGYKAGLLAAAEIAVRAQPSSVSATGEGHMRAFRDSIVMEIKGAAQNAG